MKLVSITSKYWNMCKEIDDEVLDKHNRPYVLILRLKYDNTNRIFAIPLRSNINKSEHKSMYFALPPNKSTKPRNKHGIHFRKMIPITKDKLVKYHIDPENQFDKLIQETIDKNLPKIVKMAQAYLDNYMENKPLMYATNIDELIKLLNK